MIDRSLGAASVLQTPSAIAGQTIARVKLANFRQPGVPVQTMDGTATAAGGWPGTRPHGWDGDDAVRGMDRLVERMRTARAIDETGRDEAHGAGAVEYREVNGPPGHWQLHKIQYDGDATNGTLTSTIEHRTDRGIYATAHEHIVFTPSAIKMVSTRVTSDATPGYVFTTAVVYDRVKPEKSTLQQWITDPGAEVQGMRQDT